MSTTPGTRFLDYLPAVLRQADGGGPGFAERLLDAFEAVFAGIEAEVDAIPGLVAVSPTPTLAATVPAGAATLELDSAAGLCAGDVLQLGDADAPAGVEIVELAAVEAELRPTGVRLRGALRLAHRAGTRLHVLGPAVGGAVLAAPAPAGATTLTLAGGLDAARGAALRLGAGATAEYARVDAAAPPRLILALPLASPHDVGEPVALLAPPEVATPPRAFAAAARDGAEWVLRTAARAGELAIEVDTTSDLRAGDVLQLREPDAARAERVRVDALTADAPGGAVAPAALRLREPLRFDHAAGVGLGRAGGGDRPDPLAASGHLAWLAGWIGLAPRPDRGERWNRELLRLAARAWPWRGTRAGVEALVGAYLLGDARVAVVDPAQPLQVGLVATVGADTLLGGGPPHWFWIDLTLESGNTAPRDPAGLAALVQAARVAADRERPAHTAYGLRIHAPALQIGADAVADVGARVSETTLLWEDPLVVATNTGIPGQG